MKAFFAEIYEEATAAKPGEGHIALAVMEQSGRLQRHYTLNVDGLAENVGLSTWHPVKNASGALALLSPLLISLGFAISCLPSELICYQSHFTEHALLNHLQSIKSLSSRLPVPNQSQHSHFIAARAASLFVAGYIPEMLLCWDIQWTPSAWTLSPLPMPTISSSC